MMRALKHVARSTRGRVGFALVGFLVVVVAGTSFVSPHDPVAQLDLDRLQIQPPSMAHLFGTDHLSRDVLSRVLYGARISLTIALLSVLLSATIGTGVGIAAGLVGKTLDAVVMRAVDAALAIPRMLLLLVVFALWGHVDVLGLVTVFALTSWFGTSRIVRAEVLSLRQRDFVTAAHALGLSRRRLVLHHLLPNLAAPVIVTATLGVGQIVLMEAGLSYLGLGIADPTPTLGRIIEEGYHHMLDAPWISLFPGLIIVLIVIGFSLIGDALHDSLNPRSS